MIIRLYTRSVPQHYFTDLGNIARACQREAVSSQLVRLRLQLFQLGLHHMLLGLALLRAEPNTIELQQGQAILIWHLHSVERIW